MPRNQFQRMVFAFITVVITVHAFVFYSLYVVNGATLMEINGASGVLQAINKQGGVYMFGTYLPIWAVILVEFVFAYTLEVLMGSPVSFKLACKVFDPRRNHPMLFESAIICATVGIMCPAMSLIAAVIYYPYFAGFSVVTLLANWFKLVCLNFPFAYFSQMFFIQPLVRTIFKAIFRKDIEKHIHDHDEQERRGKKVRAGDEIEAIEAIMRRVTEIKETIEAENASNESIPVNEDSHN